MLHIQKKVTNPLKAINPPKAGCGCNKNINVNYFPTKQLKVNNLIEKIAKTKKNVIYNTENKIF